MRGADQRPYILIGVADVRGGRANILGIPQTDHLADHSLQQFVNSLTNQPVRFHYEAFGFEGKQVGVIRIEEQMRPIYLKRDYGKLVREKVYVRRGSSTDPTKPASLEEVAQMRVGSGQPAAELLVEFAHVERDDALGTNVSLSAEFCEMPASKMIPDLSRSRPSNPLGIASSGIYFDLLTHPNSDFFRQLAEYEFAHRLFRPIRLVVRNVGQVAASNVRAEIAVPTNIGIAVVERSVIPTRPKRQFGFPSSSTLEAIKPAFSGAPGEVEIDKNNERLRVEIGCGDLQPGRRVWSDVFYIGKAASGELSLCGLVFADNLPQPREFVLTVSVTVTETAMTVDELCSLPGLAAGDE